ncbi:hypothetical protein KHP62_06305 [Rhodobacteraceae bacterium NNCM2]|nr:hypothetical protein [Coraliihabitans acroporae]
MTDTTLMIAMPTGGQVATPTVRSLIALTQELTARGVGFMFETYQFSDIVFSRNQLMSRFLSDARFSHLLFIDSDMEFEPEACFRLLAFGEPLTAVAYPQKRPEWERLRARIEAEAAKPEAERADMQTLLAGIWTYNHQLGTFGGGAWRPKRRGGFITVQSTGTGFMLVARSVAERMVETGAAARRAMHEDLPGNAGLRYHDFFSHRVSANGGFVYGEDQSFCHRWTEDCGGEVWLDTQSPMVHWGISGFLGRYAERVGTDFPD